MDVAYAINRGWLIILNKMNYMHACVYATHLTTSNECFQHWDGNLPLGTRSPFVTVTWVC